MKYKVYRDEEFIGKYSKMQTALARIRKGIAQGVNCYAYVVKWQEEGHQKQAWITKDGTAYSA